MDPADYPNDLALMVQHHALLAEQEAETSQAADYWKRTLFPAMLRSGLNPSDHEALLEIFGELIGDWGKHTVAKYGRMIALEARNKPPEAP